MSYASYFWLANWNMVTLRDTDYWSRENARNK